MDNGMMPAMPIELEAGEVWSEECDRADGLTKREMMAMHFHASLLGAHSDGKWSAVGRGAAAWAVAEADELIAELERTKCQS